MELIDTSGFRKVIYEKEVDLFTIKNRKGLSAQITNYGARVVSLYLSLIHI